MSKIVFICDLEEGHLLPTFRLASTLQQRSHQVIYLNVSDNEHLVKEQGFDFQVMPLRKLNADLHLVSYLLPLDILVLYYKYNIRPVVFTPFLRDVNITVMDMCIKLIDELPLEEKNI